jgi:uncharacterized protein DUF6526
MAERAQTYKNHTRLLPAFHFFVLPVLLLNFLNAIRHVWLLPTLSMVAQLFVAAALLMLAFLARIMALTVQDRVIRMEMRMRLRELLPADLQPRIRELTHRQLVAMRFASDDELPALAREVLDGRLTTGKEIKMRVKNWQADWLRA